MHENINIFWFRQDLRIADNPGLCAAASGSEPVLAIYIIDEQNSIGEASRWWLHHSLQALNQSLNHQLNVYVGKPAVILAELAQKFKVKGLYLNRCFEPDRLAEEQELSRLGLPLHVFNASLLWPPDTITKPDGSPYKVYTAFYRNGCLKAPEPPLPLSVPSKLPLLPDPDALSNFNLLPKIKWFRKLDNLWEIGETAAYAKLEHFINDGLSGYKHGRNYPALTNVSRLSPHLHFGEISPRQVWHAIKNHVADNSDINADKEFFLQEIGWREFSYYLLFHFPTLPDTNFQTKFSNQMWQPDPVKLKAWQVGATGYPIVDAGMRELWQTGYMHNRVRMIVGSFLVKNLLIDWRHGAEWFWDCLVDADLANNSASWQWVAGCGADAAPYFRIFNPVTQGEKFDPDGVYTRQFVPELAKLPNDYLFKPWEAPPAVLARAGIELGHHYPLPLVNLSESRQRALMLYKQMH